MTDAQRTERDAELLPQQMEESRRERMKRLEESLPVRYRGATLDGYRVTNKGQAVILKAVRELSARLKDAVMEGQNVVFYGSCGTGKDHLAAALLREVAAMPWHPHRGARLEWTRGTDFYGYARSRTHGRDSMEWHHFRDCEVLLVSDPILPQGDVAGWIANEAYGLFDRRYGDRKGTWITCNASSPQDLSAKLSPQLADRLLEGAAVFDCFWPSFRSEAKG